MTVKQIVAHFNTGKIQGSSIRHTESQVGYKQTATKQ